MSKLFVGMVAFSVALFGAGRIVGLVGHGKPFSGVAWAQDAGDSTGDGADVGTEPDKKVKVPPPDIAGDWNGSIMDDESGSISFAIAVFQKKSKIMGTWVLGGGDDEGSYKGKINEAGTELKFELKQKHTKCSISAEGTIEIPEASTAIVTEPTIEGSYVSKKCDGVTQGSFTVSMPLIIER